jgi:hypothetical protein
MKHETIHWALWFVILWVFVVISVLVLMLFLPFRMWSIVATLAFGTMEVVGLVREQDAFPPLTWVIRRYLPRWLAFAAIYAAVGGAGAYWFRVSRAERVAALFALLGWLTAHFDQTYDGELPRLEPKTSRKTGGASS